MLMGLNGIKYGKLVPVIVSGVIIAQCGGTRVEVGGCKLRGGPVRSVTTVHTLLPAATLGVSNQSSHR